MANLKLATKRAKKLFTAYENAYDALEWLDGNGDLERAKEKLQSMQELALWYASSNPDERECTTCQKLPDTV